MPTITICSSAAFYRQVVDIQDKLDKQGFNVIIPDTAEKMKQAGDFDVSHHKTWFADASDYHKKAALMRGHFNELEKGDAVLVLNYEKHGVKNYIGGNVLMEMAIAFYLKKFIFIFNEIPSNSQFLEEIMGMQPVELHGEIKVLPKLLKK